ncbi:uncharacterized protein N7506_009240 [Penicillium brevicompactum]|uniref:uncharacterized protein n=1 Tax=Penicillium brevicompactum TaxID=5074 RepID=UPI0025400246|nr:uncharacterized protein N7506_009240 [Penicillium brevicompactum]KAJ5326138.1 hypothetical protein N7506_009240 [Penicillium brevicompactum]
MSKPHNSDLPPSYDASQASQDPPPYHNWQEAVPDTTSFPPPPITGYLISGTGNAPEDDAQRAHDFCNTVPLWLPTRPSPVVYATVQDHDLRPVHPRELQGTVSTVRKGQWYGRSQEGNKDCVILTSLPLYFAAEDAGSRKTIYFEVKYLRQQRVRGGDAPGFSLGFVAQPYPSWRSPGWERGGLGVFSDDGCRFVNDSFGGRDFTSEILPGETVGIGMEFAGSKEKKGKVNVFFTRNGRHAGGWDLHEEVDEESGGIEGLEGDYDLYGAIGLFGGVEFESCFDPAGWLWRPE